MPVRLDAAGEMQRLVTPRAKVAAREQPVDGTTELPIERDERLVECRSRGEGDDQQRYVERSGCAPLRGEAQRHECPMVR